MSYMLNMKYLLFSNCISVSGWNRSIICDLQYRNYHLIPNSLFQILNKHKGVFDSRIFDEYDDFKNVIHEYLQFLKQNNLVFQTSTSVRFPKFPLVFESPSIVNNAIIDVKKNSNFSIFNIIGELNKFTSQAVHFRLFDKFNCNEILSILEPTRFSKIRSIELTLKYNEDLSIADLDIIYRYNARITKITIFNSINNEIKYLQINSKIPVLFRKDFVFKNCGAIHPILFLINNMHFTESQHFNTCLNQKICIDVDGNIKNCPSMERSFGNIKDITLEEAINMPGFKDLWGIRKDDIDVCKDCEFRYMCTDCRCFIKKSDDIYSQPAKCLYNPYIAKWSNEDGYISVEEWRFNNPNWEKSAKRNPLVKIPQNVE